MTMGKDISTDYQQAINGIEKHRNDIFSFVSRRLGNIEDAEDVTQEVIARALQRIDTLQNISAVFPWLLRIAYNLVVDVYRKQNQEKQIFHQHLEDPVTMNSTLTWGEEIAAQETEHNSPEQALLTKEFRDVVDKCKRELTDRELLLVVLSEEKVRRRDKDHSIYVLIRDHELDMIDKLKRGGVHGSHVDGQTWWDSLSGDERDKKLKNLKMRRSRIKQKLERLLESYLLLLLYSLITLLLLFQMNLIDGVFR